MSNPVESDTCVPDTQETRYEGANESLKIMTSETQETSLNESQDFRLVDSEGDESMVDKLKQILVGEANHEKSIDQADSQQIPETLQTEENNTITANDKEDETIIDERVKESDAIEKITENVSTSELCESEKNDDLFDEDEIIQGTPPQSYSPSRKVGSVDVNLKRKASTFDEPPAKIPRMSEEDAAKLQKRLEEESQSCGSDDSYQDLFKNVDKNVIIEETQETATVEFTRNTLKTPAEHTAETTNDDKAQEHHAEQTNQQGEKCDVEKDENLNVSAKLTDVSNNDSTTVNFNSTCENDLLEENNVSIGKEDVTSTAVIEKSEKGTLNELVKDTETASDENNQSNCVKPTEKTVDKNVEEIPFSQTKSRSSVELISIEETDRIVDSKSKPQIVEIDDDDEKILNSSTEVIYDRQSTKKKPEIVQIDDSHEDGEKILSLLEKKEIEVSEIQVMDKSYEGKSSYESKSYENKSSYKESMNGSSQESKSSDKRLVNGSAESKKSDADTTVSLDSDTFSASEELLLPAAATTAAHDMKKIDGIKSVSFEPMGNIEFISISDHETSNVDEKNKSDLIYNTLEKTKQEEREIGIYVKLKCLMHMDENTKELVKKELTVVQCEPIIESNRQKNEDSQTSLADISDNKESSPGSVNSNPQLYQLFPPRWSIMSSSSSASSAASLAFKMAKNSGHLFTMPTGPPKHTKKSSQDIPSTVLDKQTLDETYDRLTHEWKNHRLLIATILNYANMELSNTSAIATSTIVDTFANVSNERLDDHHHHHLEKNNMRSSTPSDHSTNSKMELTATPKSTKKGGKAAKRPRSKLTRSNAAQINGDNGAKNISNEPALHTSVMETDTPSKKKSKLEEDEQLVNDVGTSAKSPRSMLADELIGKNVFAKWSDNNYYLGTVSDRLKAKYKVNFYDGKSKTLIPEFVIPIPKILKKGLSVYATTKTDDYGSCGIIIDVETSTNGDTHYTVETDEGEKLRVQIQNISLSADQAQVLKEEVDSVSKSSLPSTPKALGQVTLDNMVDGKRRSKRIGTPLSSTPKSRNNAGGSSTSISIKSEPSVSGMSAKLKKEKALSESEGMSSDSNVESTRSKLKDEYTLMGIQREIIGTPFEQIAKGPQSRNKSKSRSKKKEDPEMIATLGPIPTNSDIFKGTSFILTCIPLEKLERFQDMKTNAASNTEAEAAETDFETEYEDDWVKRNFIRERLHEQIIAGGGKIYEDFEKIPENEYKETILITNVPNTTAKSILCLSAGIHICNHEFVIRSCLKGKIVNKDEVALPNGWSLQREAYVESYETFRKKPLSEIVVIIPSLASINLPQFATFWRQVCEHAGAVVIIAESSDAMETDFANTVVVVSNWKCPLWAQKRAIQLNIPILSTTWVVQCIIEGKLCPQNHPRYSYTYIPN